MHRDLTIEVEINPGRLVVGTTQPERVDVLVAHFYRHKGNLPGAVIDNRDQVPGCKTGEGQDLLFGEFHLADRPRPRCVTVAHILYRLSSQFEDLPPAPFDLLGSSQIDDQHAEEDH